MSHRWNARQSSYRRKKSTCGTQSLVNFVVSKNVSETISDDKNTSMISTSLSLAESADAGLQAQSSGSSGSSVDPLDRRVDVKSDSVDPGISRARDDAHEVQKYVNDCDSEFLIAIKLQLV